MNDTSGKQSRLRRSVIAGLSLALLTALASGCRGGTEPAANEPATAQTPKPSAQQPLPVATIAPVARAESLTLLSQVRVPVGIDGNRQLVGQLLSNLVEMNLESRQILRIAAYRLIRSGQVDLALPLLRKVLVLAPFEPQSWRDLGLALAAQRGIAEFARDGERKVWKLQHFPSLADRHVLVRGTSATS